MPEIEEEEQEIPPANREQETIVARLVEIKRTQAELTEEKDSLERLLDESIETSVLAYVDGEELRVTPVRSNVTNIDYEAFAVAAPEVYADAVKVEEKLVLNPKIVERALQTGKLQPAEAAAFISVKPKKTSVRITPVVHGETEEEN